MFYVTPAGRCGCTGSYGGSTPAAPTTQQLLHERVAALERQLDEQEARHSAEKAALREAYQTTEERLRRKCFELAVTRFECDGALAAHYAEADVTGPPRPAERIVASTQTQSLPKGDDAPAWPTARRASELDALAEVALARVYTFRSLGGGTPIGRVDVLVTDSHGHRWAGSSIGAMRMPLEAMSSGYATMHIAADAHDAKTVRLLVPAAAGASRHHSPASEECVLLAESVHGSAARPAVDGSSAWSSAWSSAARAPARASAPAGEAVVTGGYDLALERD